jgi:hypothetical protein
VTLPYAELCTSTTSVYVPLAGSVRVSTKPPPAPSEVGATSVVPSGFRMEIFVLQQVGPTLRLTRAPAVPWKVRTAFWPGVVVETLTGVAFGAIVPVTSGGTS